MPRKIVARYVLIDLQETNYVDVLDLIPGWWENAQDALMSVGGNKEYQCARKLDFTEEFEDFIKGRSY